MPTIRLLLAIAINRQWPVLQLDISNAFLHGDLLDDIYMRQSLGFTDATSPNFVCKLHKSLYGLKQAPRQWFQKLTSFLQTKGFRFSRSDPSLLLFTQNQVQIYFLIYVDNILVTGNDQSAVQFLLKDLKANFALKQPSPISLFLGIQVHKFMIDYILSQAHFAQKILTDAGFADCKSAPTPISPNSNQLHSNPQPFHDPTFYRRIAVRSNICQ
ncbi:Retrovirus-related Pol polyprotein from transposon TNT 1-94 [Dendrobium catenatum]|uniref:Retrovirus-related Pol polyprotein from transposon TNT 1-94 n=1 Tax=Dendrobium catenatum TaxID=906689 RepID=A0A2I0WUX0_9ASPA|nr:Retrovirus-related Pol polyprotein from transposon TNT 1-94 [Dendrobium catenatum]